MTDRIRRSVALAACVALWLVALAAPAHAAFSGGNGKIAFSGGDGFDVWVMNADGSEATNLTNSPYPADKDISPAWSPDGQKIVFESNRDSHNNTDIYTMNQGGTDVKRLTFLDSHNRTPAWSPDGHRIVFSSNRAGPTFPDEHIWTMNMDGTDPTRITFGDHIADYDPQWSPNGAKIAFGRREFIFDDEGDVVETGGGMYVMNADGTGVTRLTDGGGYKDWAPDSSRLVFDAQTSSEDRDLYLINPDGTGLHNLTNTPTVNEGTPVWSPDGTKILFFSSEVPFGLNTMNPDGTGRAFLGLGYLPDWQPIPGPSRSDYKNASKFCKAERAFFGYDAFGRRYGGGANAYGKCVAGS